MITLKWRCIESCALALVFGHAAVAAELIRLTPQQQKSTGIETGAIEARRASTLQGLPAQVTVPNQQLRVVSTPLAGLVESISVTTQQPVRKGQVVARLQSPGLADVQHTYLQASAQHQLARAGLDRDENLFAEGIIAASRLETTRSRLQEVSADLAERTQALRAAGMSDAAMARLRSGQVVGSAIELVAPIDGVVLEQMAIAGQRLEAAALVMKIARLDPLWIEIQVPADRMAGIAEGAAASVPAANAKGRVISIGRAVSSGTQTLTVRAEIREGAARLRPGQLVEAVLSAAGGAPLWGVPTSALARLGGRTMVYALAPGGFLPIGVTVVEEGAENALISAPFKGEERIAVKGVSTLKAMQSGVGGKQ